MIRNSIQPSADIQKRLSEVQNPTIKLSGSSAIPAEPIKGEKTSLFKRFFSTKTLVLVAIVIIVAVQLVSLYTNILTIQLVQNTPYLQELGRNKDLKERVSKLTTINMQEEPLVTTITDADNLRSENAIQAEVYRNVKNGDVILAFTDKIVIYRQSENKIIYDGDSPGTILEKGQNEVISKINAKAKAAGLIQQESTETPNLSIIGDEEQVKAQDPKFYALARKGDVVGIYPIAKVIVIYNLQSDAIIKSGRVDTTIR